MGATGIHEKSICRSIAFPKGSFASLYKAIERVENKYWKIEILDFQFWMLGFFKFTGEWKTTELGEKQVLVEYTYHLNASNILLYPLNVLFGKIFWRTYMKRVLENIRKLAYDNEPYYVCLRSRRYVPIALF